MVVCVYLTEVCRRRYTFSGWRDPRVSVISESVGVMGLGVLLGKCVEVQGTVVRVSSIKLMVTTLAFSCSLCRSTQALMLTDGKYSLPNKVCVSRRILLVTPAAIGSLFYCLPHMTCCLTYVCVFQCSNPECRSRTFVTQRSSPLTQTMDWQTIKYVGLKTNGLFDLFGL